MRRSSLLQLALLQALFIIQRGSAGRRRLVGLHSTRSQVLQTQADTLCTYACMCMADSELVVLDMC